MAEIQSMMKFPSALILNSGEQEKAFTLPWLTTLEFREFSGLFKYKQFYKRGMKVYFVKEQ